MPVDTLNKIMYSNFEAYVEIAQYISAALVVGLGSMGVARAQGGIAQSACESIAQNPSAEKGIRSIFQFGMIVVEASAIYCLFMALLILFR
jgi:F-type H+-transporting ATPase subunit c